MKTILLSTLALISLIFIAGCSESTSPAEDPSVSIIAEMATPTVSEIGKALKNNKILEDEVDSIKILRIRILMSRLLMFVENDNTTQGAVIKLEPFVYDISLTGDPADLGKSDVPAGLYEKIKIEIHRFSTNELAQYANDPIFADFATEERHTILIEGITYIDENPSTFVFKTNIVANLSLMLEPLLNLKDNSKATIAIQVDPNYFFKKWESILDPNNLDNAKDIENSLINTIKALKK